MTLGDQALALLTECLTTRRYRCNLPPVPVSEMLGQVGVQCTAQGAAPFYITPSPRPLAVR